MKSKVVVFRGSGFLGSHVVGALSEKKFWEEDKNQLYKAITASSLSHSTLFLCSENRDAPCLQPFY